jgi:hypothetical protein
MMKFAIGFAAVCLMVPAMAAAQTDDGSGGAGAGNPSSDSGQNAGGQGGGMGGGGQGRGHGGHHGGGQSAPPTGGKPAAPPPLKLVPVDQVPIIGVVTAIDPATQRITIQYQETEALNLPAGTTPFEVSKSALMNGVTVGEKVRFRVDSHQIADIRPF